MHGILPCKRELANAHRHASTFDLDLVGLFGCFGRLPHQHHLVADVVLGLGREATIVHIADSSFTLYGGLLAKWRRRGIRTSSLGTASLVPQARDHSQLLDIVAKLLELLLHNVVLLTLLSFIERSLHDLLEQDQAQVLQLSALIEVNDPFRKDRAYLLDKLLINLHQLNQILRDIGSMAPDQLHDLLVHKLFASILLADFDSLILEISIEYLFDLLDMNFTRLQLYLLARAAGSHSIQL